MMELPEALNEIRRALRVLQAFEQAEEVATFLEGVEQQTREKQAALAAVNESLAAARAAADKETAEIESRLTSARSRVRDQEAAAEAAGKSRLAAAEERAAQITAKADVEVAAAKDALASARDQRKQEETRVRDARAELESLEARIAEARETVRKLLG